MFGSVDQQRQEAAIFADGDVTDSPDGGGKRFIACRIELTVCGRGRLGGVISRQRVQRVTGPDETRVGLYLPIARGMLHVQ